MVIGVDYVCCILMDGGVYVVYCGVVIVEYYYVFVFYVDIGFIGGFIKVYDLFSVSDQEWQCVVNIWGVFVVQFIVY